MAHSFKTLTDFHEALGKTNCTNFEGKFLDLETGLSNAVKLLHKVKKQNKKVFFIGNGGSAAIASHQALDLWNHGGIQSYSFNDSALLTGISNDYGFENVFARPFDEFSSEGDLLIAISSSGRSKNIISAVQVAIKKGCKIIGFSGFDKNNPLSLLSNLSFYVPSHSYGIVETVHFLLTHAIIDQVAKSKKTAKSNLPLHSDLSTTLKREIGRMDLMNGRDKLSHSLNS